MKLGPTFKDILTPLGLSCVPFYHQIRANEPLLCAASGFWIPTWHVFTSMVWSYAPLLKNLVQSWVSLTLVLLSLPLLKRICKYPDFIIIINIIILALTSDVDKHVVS